MNDRTMRMLPIWFGILTVVMFFLQVQSVRAGFFDSLFSRLLQSRSNTSGPHRNGPLGSDSPGWSPLQIQVCSDKDTIVEGDPVRITYSGTGTCTTNYGTTATSFTDTPLSTREYSVTCTYPDSNGGNFTGTACVTVTVLHYRVCHDGAIVPEEGEVTISDPVLFRSYFDEGTGCGGNEVTSSTEFSSENDPNDAVTVSGSTLTSRGNDGIPDLHEDGQQTATENIAATYVYTWPYDGSRTRNFVARTWEWMTSGDCEVDCSFRDASQYCSDVGFRVVDTCGNTIENGCLGSRDCSFNWVEPSEQGL